MRRSFAKAILALALIVYSTALAEALTIKLEWDPSNDPKVVGYKLHYGTESRKYSKSIDVKGRLDSRTSVPNLQDGKDYYFAVTAYYANGQESAPGNEVTTAVAKPAAPSPQNVSGASQGAAAPAVENKIPGRTVESSQGKIAPSRRTADPGSGEDARIPPSRKF